MYTVAQAACIPAACAVGIRAPCAIVSSLEFHKHQNHYIQAFLCQYDITLFDILRDIGTWYACIRAESQQCSASLPLDTSDASTAEGTKQTMKSSTLLHQHSNFVGFMRSSGAFVQGTSWCRKRCISTILFV